MGYVSLTGEVTERVANSAAGPPAQRAGDLIGSEGDVSPLTEKRRDSLSQLARPEPPDRRLIASAGRGVRSHRPVGRCHAVDGRS